MKVKITQHRTRRWEIQFDGTYKHLITPMTGKYIMQLQEEIEMMRDLISSFDWEIRGNHALTLTCTRLTSEQIKLLNEKI